MALWTHMKFFKRKRPRIYLDYAAATPVRKEVRKVMQECEKEYFANASAIHAEGVATRRVIENVRVRLARLLKVRPKGIIFTGSGTEGNNLAILGAVEDRHKEGIAYVDMEVVSTRIEHPSVSRALDHLEALGIVVRYMEVDQEGMITASSLQSVLTEKTVIVTFAYANSEIGVVQEVGKLTRIVRAFETKYAVRVLVHIDAAQAPLWLPCQLENLHVDILTLDAGKCCGPKGVGVLVIRHGVKLKAVSYGGPQESNLRPATENTVGIVGAVEAIVRAQEGVEKRVMKVVSLRDRTISELCKIDGVLLNGSNTHRIANNINISIPGIDSEFAVISLDEAGIACSTKSACSGASGEGSSVVLAMTGDVDRATSTIRFTLGEDSTTLELRKTVEFLRLHIVKMREAQKQLTIR